MSIIIKNSSGGGITLDSSTTANETLALPAGGGAILSDTSTLASSKLSGALPAIDGGSLTGISGISLGTAVATTSGTSIDFTGIPAGVNRVTIMFNGVSTSGSSEPLIQIGTAEGVETSSYVSTSTHFSANAVSATLRTSGFNIKYGSSSDVSSGAMILNRLSGNRFVASLSTSATGSGIYAAYGSGNKLLAGELSILRLTTVNGTDTFDAGSVNISWES